MKEKTTDYFRITARTAAMLAPGMNNIAVGDFVGKAFAYSAGVNVAFFSGTNHALTTVKIAYAWTRPHFGGARLWLVCPLCGRRCGAVYLAHKKSIFDGSGRQAACRRCLALAYPCQYLPTYSRGLVLMNKWKDKINEGGPRPKGMHKRTVKRYTRRIEERYLAGMIRVLGGKTRGFIHKLRRDYGYERQK